MMQFKKLTLCRNLDKTRAGATELLAEYDPTRIKTDRMRYFKNQLENGCILLSIVDLEN